MILIWSSRSQGLVSARRDSEMPPFEKKSSMMMTLSRRSKINTVRRRREKCLRTPLPLSQASPDSGKSRASNPVLGLTTMASKTIGTREPIIYFSQIFEIYFPLICFL